MEWKFRCKACGDVFDNATQVRNHWFTDHTEVVRYADPVAVDKFEPYEMVEEQEPIRPPVRRPVVTPARPVGRPKLPEPDEDDGEIPEEEQEAEPEPEPERFVRKKTTPRDDDFQDLRL